jgi:metallo-beta-lactamase family protein
MKIIFLGAAKTVTGSKHLIQTQGYNLLLDCGLYQGKRKISNELNRNLPFSAGEIDSVILSHAHLDHCGTLPILVRDGFKGKIYCTGATAEIAKYILQDSAVIQEQDAIYFNRHLKGGEEPIVPIYTTEDVQRVFERFETTPYFRDSKKWTELNENIRFKLYDAGHILGSSIVFLEIKEGEKVKTLAFTGDLGREYLPILRSPEYLEEKTENLLLECTYGDTVHRPFGDVLSELKEIINRAIRKRSKIIVPAFSLGRIQELIYVLHKLIDEKSIPSLPIYLDSPLGENITEVFSKYTEYFDDEFWKDFGNRKESPFLFDNLVYIRSAEESKSLNDVRGPFIVISASGMAEGGRILHHLKRNISDPNNIVLITGYQAENTLGRRIQDGISPVEIFGSKYPVRAEVIVLDELSAHADKNDLLTYISRTKDLKRLFLIHTESSRALFFERDVKKSFPSLSVNIPDMGQVFDI